MFVDFVTLSLTIYGLYRSGLLRPQSHSLWTAVYEQGVVYFLIAVSTNIPTLVSHSE